MNDYEIQKIRDTAFCSGYNTAVSKYEKQNKELQEENAELKEDVKYYEQKHERLVTEWDNAKRQLTKAKEIIKELMSFSVQLCDCRHTVDFEKTREEAEQFLSEVENV